MLRRVFRLPRSVVLAAIVLAACSTGTEQPTALFRPPSGPATRDQAPTPSLVISQVYGGGGNAGATFTNDFIEVFNPGTTAVNVAGWSVQYASSAGTTWAVTALTGTIQPGKYLLVQEAQGAGGTTPLPTPDATGTIAMAAGAGKVLLSSGVAALTGNCPTTAAVIDHVGYGGADCGLTTAVWTSNAPVLTNTTSDSRNSGGCAFTGSPATDFTAGAPNPRNSTAATNTCGTVAQPVASVTVTPNPGSVSAGATQAFTAVAHDAGNNVVATTFTWASSVTAAATVDANGVATGVAEGTTTITATAANGVSGGATLNVTPAVAAAAGDIVISQIYGGGGNAGTTLTNDFIELFNRSSTAVNVTGWSVQYTSSTGTAWQVTTLSGTMQPGKYYLVQEAAGTGGTTPLPTS